MKRHGLRGVTAILIIHLRIPAIHPATIPATGRLLRTGITTDTLLMDMYTTTGMPATTTITDTPIRAGMSGYQQVHLVFSRMGMLTGHHLRIMGMDIIHITGIHTFCTNRAIL